MDDSKFITCCCSHEYDTVEQQGKKTWKYYRYSLTIEYYEKPPLAPPLIVINLLMRTVTYPYRRRRTKITTCDCSKLTLPEYYTF